VIERYIKNDFNIKKDPAINSILIQKLLKCSPASTMTTRVNGLSTNVGNI